MLCGTITICLNYNNDNKIITIENNKKNNNYVATTQRYVLLEKYVCLFAHYSMRQAIIGILQFRCLEAVLARLFFINMHICYFSFFCHCCFFGNRKHCLPIIRVSSISNQVFHFTTKIPESFWFTFKSVGEPTTPTRKSTFAGALRVSF